MIVALFFVAHWQFSVTLQSLFHHRYGAHRQFAFAPGWERVFHLLTFAVQGPSYLSTRAYAIMHRQHHAYSDTPKDPHSPTQHSNVLTMMWRTLKRYRALVSRRVEVEPRFEGGYPEWPLLERIASHWGVTLLFSAAYVAFYVAFAPSAWLFLLLPFHFVMGPVHGAIVNWCGHRYGYRNYPVGDVSRNTLPFDFLTGGELFQNNHHRYGMSPNFAARRWEIDPTYWVIRGLAWLRIIDKLGTQRMRYPEPAPSASAAARAA